MGSRRATHLALAGLAVVTCLAVVPGLAGCGQAPPPAPAPVTTGTVHKGAVTKTLIAEGAMGGGNGAVVAVQDTVWNELAVGQPVRLMVDVVPDVDIKAKVQTISPYATVINQQRQYHYVNIEIVDPVDPRMLPSQRVRAMITTLDVPNVLVVPNGAISDDGGRRWVSTPDGRRLPFTPGAVGDDVTEVRGGLTDGQQVQVQPVTR